MLTLSPINSDIQDTLKEKMGMLKKMSGATDEYIIGTPLSTTTGDVLKNYMFARTPFLRMTSFSPQTEDKFATVLMGGDLRGGSTNYPMNRLRAGFEDYKADVGSTITGNADDPFINYLGLYTQPDKTIIDDIPYRPTAGLKDISIEYRGGGMRLGSTRTAEISWTCWTWQELENYRPHFLHHGRMILLEWGWSGDGILWEGNSPFYDVLQGNTLKIHENKIVNLNQKLLDHVLSQKGHYDAMLGLIQDFTWTVNDDGAFDCSTKLISQGITILQKSQRRNAVQSTASLPLLASEDATTFGWFPGADDTAINFAGDQTVEVLAPYISIQEYMADFPQQVAMYLWKIGSVFTSDRSKHVEAHGMKVFRIDKFSWKVLKAEEKTAPDKFVQDGQWDQTGDPRGRNVGGGTYIEYTTTYSGDKDFGIGVDPVGTYVADQPLDKQQTKSFCSWGWFEDNVLSRFFGTVGEVEGLGDKLIGEFRSIEPVLDADSVPVKLTAEDIKGEFSDSEEGAQAYESTKMTNSKYLITTDSSKWIIPNEGDPFLTHITVLRWHFHPTQIAEGFKGQKYNLFTSPGPKPSALKVKGSCKSNREAQKSGMIRNVYFNANYLKDKFKDSTDIVSSVMSVWDDFSKEYGGVYKFKVDFADDGKRAMIVEEGYTGVSVDDAITDPDKKSKVFEFPVWKSDSIVKSQNISAKVPKRMQLAAMYGTVSQKDEGKEEGVQHASNEYDDLVAKAWGRYVEDLPSDTTGMSQEQIKQQRYKDMLHGKIDSVHRGNRYFGQAKADVNQELFLGKLSDSDPVTATADKRGIQIFDSILNELQDIQKQELFDLMKEISDANVNEDEGRLDTESGVALRVNQEEQKAFAAVDALTGTKSDKNGTSKDTSEWYRFYKIMEGNSNYQTLKLKTGLLFQLQQYLRGHNDGILKNIDPLLPIDFELDVDGIAGIFPGNSFHSSYLPQKYKDGSLFQAVGVSHKIDNSGWITTIKGQIRAVSQLATIKKKLAEEKVRKEKAEADRELEKLALAEQNEKDRIARELAEKKRIAKLPKIPKNDPDSVSDELLASGQWQVDKEGVGKSGARSKIHYLNDEKLISRREGLIMATLRTRIITTGGIESWVRTTMDIDSEAFKSALRSMARYPISLDLSNPNSESNTDFLQSFQRLYNLNGGG